MVLRDALRYGGDGFVTAAEQEWEPGDPLPGRYRRSIHQGFLYNFRECEYSEECHCPDRAQWPDPLIKELPSEEWFINYFKKELGVDG